jgi:hypothetical protein
MGTGGDKTPAELDNIVPTLCSSWREVQTRDATLENE